MKRVLKSLLLAGAALAVLAIARPASAQTLSLQAQVANACRFSTSTAIDFGTYDPINVNDATGSPLNGTGSVEFRCTRGSTYHIGLDNGAGGTTRRLSAGGADVLTYQLYSDATRTTVWGTGASAVAGAPVANSAPITLTVYGQIGRGQDVAAGTYVDTVNVTVVP